MNDKPNGFTPPAPMPPAQPQDEWEGGLELTISRHKDSGWWRIVGPLGSGLFIANPSLDLCVGDIIQSWRLLSELSPDQIVPFPAEPRVSPQPKREAE